MFLAPAANMYRLLYAEIHEAYKDEIPSYVGIDARVLNTWQGLVISYKNYLDSDEIVTDPGKLTYEQRMKYAYRNIRGYMRRLKYGDSMPSYDYLQRRR